MSGLCGERHIRVRFSFFVLLENSVARGKDGLGKKKIEFFRDLDIVSAAINDLNATFKSLNERIVVSALKSDIKRRICRRAIEREAESLRC